MKTQTTGILKETKGETTMLQTQVDGINKEQIEELIKQELH